MWASEGEGRGGGRRGERERGEWRGRGGERERGEGGEVKRGKHVGLKDGIWNNEWECTRKGKMGNRRTYGKPACKGWKLVVIKQQRRRRRSSKGTHTSGATPPYFFKLPLSLPLH
jgi:hypothetical protein